MIRKSVSCLLLLCVAATTAPTTQPTKVFHTWKSVVALIPADDMPTTNGIAHGAHWGKVEMKNAEAALTEKLVGNRLTLRSMVNWVRKEDGGTYLVSAGAGKNDTVGANYCTLSAKFPDDGRRLGLTQRADASFNGIVKAVSLTPQGRIDVELADCQVKH